MLFCGINPGLYSGAVGHHFARPGNRFWPVLHRAGFTDRELTPFEEEQLLEVGLGITNLVNRTTAKAADLNASELRRGAATLRRKTARYAPLVVAVLGMSAFRVAFGRPHAGVNLVSSHQVAGIYRVRKLGSLGPQTETLGRGALWVLPNPSGLNAHYQLPQLAELFTALRVSARRAGQGR